MNINKNKLNIYHDRVINLIKSSTICFLKFQKSKLIKSGSLPKVKHSAIQQIQTIISSSVSIFVQFSVRASISSSFRSIAYKSEAICMMLSTLNEISSSSTKINQNNQLTLVFSTLSLEKVNLIVQNLYAHQYRSFFLITSTQVYFIFTYMLVISVFLLLIFRIIKKGKKYYIMIEILIQ